MIETNAMCAICSKWIRQGEPVFRASNGQIACSSEHLAKVEELLAVAKLEDLDDEKSHEARIQKKKGRYL